MRNVLLIDGHPDRDRSRFVQALADAYADEGAMPKPLLGGRSARLVVTMGMPAIFHRFYFGAHSMKSFERNILKFADIKQVASSLIGNVEDEAKARIEWLDKRVELGANAA